MATLWLKLLNFNYYNNLNNIIDNLFFTDSVLNRTEIKIGNRIGQSVSIYYRRQHFDLLSVNN